MGPECCHEIDRSLFFPYQRILRGGKLLTLPVRDSNGTICGFDPTAVQGSNAAASSAAVNSCGCPIDQPFPSIRKIQCVSAPSVPTMGDYDQVPMAAAMKKALIPTEADLCKHHITPLQRMVARTSRRQTSLQERLKARIKDMEDQSSKAIYPTPMSLFRNDERNLRRAYRNYKRDVQLQKERGTYMEQPKYFPDEITKLWYYDMVMSGNPCVETVDRETQGLLNRTDCFQFVDGGSCFHCPERHMSTEQNLDRSAQASLAGAPCSTMARCDC